MPGSVASRELLRVVLVLMGMHVSDPRRPVSIIMVGPTSLRASCPGTSEEQRLRTGGDGRSGPAAGGGRAERLLSEPGAVSLEDEPRGGDLFAGAEPGETADNVRTLVVPDAPRVARPRQHPDVVQLK